MLKQFIVLSVLFGSVAAPAVAQVQIPEAKARQVAEATQDPLATYALGQNELSDMNYEKAASFFRKSIAQAQSSKSEVQSLARLALYTTRKMEGTHLLLTGQPKASIPAFEAAQALQPDDVFVLQQLAKAYDAIGDKQLSQTYINLALEHASEGKEKAVIQETKNLLLSKS